MKNLKKIIVSFITLTMLMCSIASAATANDITQAVKDAGFGAYSANVSSYLQAHEITEAQGDSVIKEIKEVKAILNGRAFSELTLDEKTSLKNHAEAAASIVGLTVKVNAGNVTIVDAKGNVIQEITTSELAALVNALNFDKLENLLSVVIDYHKNPDKSFKPSGGTMQKTATSYGNYMVLGAGLILAAGAIFAIGKKKALS